MSHLWGEDEGGSSVFSPRYTQQFSIYNATSKVDNPIPLRDEQTNLT